MEVRRARVWRRRAWRGIKTGLALVPIAVIVLWLVFQHKPGWYRPESATEATILTAQTETAALADQIGDNLAVGRSFDVTVTDRQVNGWLACLDQILPGNPYRMPAEFSGPAVHFEDGRIRVGLHYSDNGWRVILNAALRAELIEGGNAIRISIAQVRGGSLASPRWLLQRLLDACRPSAPAPPRDRGGPSGFALWINRIESVDELFDGVTIPNRFVWPNGEWPFRVGAIDSGAGTTRLSIQPL